MRERTDDVPAVIKTYTELTESMLDVDEVIASEFGDAALLRTAMGLHHVVHVREQVLYQQSVVLSGLTRGLLTTAEVRTLVESNVKLGYIAGEFAALATPDQLKTYGKNFNGPDIESAPHDAGRRGAAPDLGRAANTGSNAAKPRRCRSRRRTGPRRPAPS